MTYTVCDRSQRGCGYRLPARGVRRTPSCLAGPAYALKTWTVSDEELAVSAKVDETNRRALWARLEPRVRLFNQARFQNLARAAEVEIGDLLTEAYFVYLEAIKHFDESRRRSFWAYYSSGLVNHYIDLTKRNRHFKFKADLDKAEKSAPNHDGPRGEVEVQMIIEAAVAAGVKDRALKVMLYKLNALDGWTLNELSLSFGRPVSTVHSWVEEVKEAVKRNLGVPGGNRVARR